MINFTGFVGVIEGTDIISKLIKFFGKARISHMVIGAWDEFLLESTMPRTKISRLSKYKKTIVWYKIKGKTDIQLDPIVKIVAKKYLDIRYGLFELVGWMWAAIWKAVTGKVIKNWFNKGKDAIVCAELVLYYLRDELRMNEFDCIDIHEAEFMAKMHEIIIKSNKFKKVKV